jgi:hypothetical protein
MNAARAQSHSLTLEQADVQPCGGESQADVGEALRRAQWLRDLETLGRIESQNECFFDAMGELARDRMEGQPG